MKFYNRFIAVCGAAALHVLLLMSIQACTSPLATMRRAALANPANGPGYTPPKRDDCDRGLLVLADRIDEWGLTFVFDNSPEPTHMGSYDPTTKRIVIAKKLSTCGMLETLAHELAHHIAPAEVWQMGNGMAQLYADGVSLLVVNELGGYNPADNYGRYWAAQKPIIDHLMALEVDIKQGAAYIVTGKKP